MLFVASRSAVGFDEEPSVILDPPMMRNGPPEFVACPRRLYHHCYTSIQPRIALELKWEDETENDQGCCEKGDLQNWKLVSTPRAMLPHECQSWTFTTTSHQKRASVRKTDENWRPKVGYLKLDIHRKTVLLHFDQQPVCFPLLQADLCRWIIHGCSKSDYRLLPYPYSSSCQTDSYPCSLSAHTGDLSPASKDRISLLWPNGMNGNPTTLEFQTLPQSDIKV
ncbi:hypothetical protein AVEN_163610-1 [Araneus ventricosus]|uniref:Uncharacterized protein n=1 Tax=Araneus ventricosus TaxID=182803 RepID=A0A4Y2U6C8_ARAVE|nr:hypothetical protein AVEN_163610-1 [Araneus ventricosus]